MTAVLIDRADGVARLTLNRPERGNAVDMALAEGLRDAAAAAAGDIAVRCVILTGAGRLFCAGGDLDAFVERKEDVGDYLRSLATTLHEAVTTLSTMAKPLVCLVNGAAAGAGLSLAALGDIVLAARSAHFTAAYAKLGLTPDGGMSWLLPRLVGLRRAQEMILTNRRISAEEAAASGLVTRVVDGDVLSAEGNAIAASLVAGPTVALGLARGLLQDGAARDFAGHLRAEAAMIACAGAAPEAQEAIAAFADRRTAEFRSYGRHHGS